MQISNGDATAERGSVESHPYEIASCHTLQYDYLIPIKVLGAELELFSCPLSYHFEVIWPVVSGQWV